MSKQPGSHAYKLAQAERVDIPNHLDRDFDVDAPNKVRCGDITYIWADSRWHYLAVVIDLYRCRVIGSSLSTSPDAELVAKALDMAYGQRGSPQGVLFHSDQGCQYSHSPSSVCHQLLLISKSVYQAIRLILRVKQSLDTEEGHHLSTTGVIWL